MRQVGLPTIRGLAGNDRISAGIAYRMFGDEDRDFLLGGRNDDEISGGDDADLLIGGGGADLFIYDTDFASLPDKEGRWSPATGDTIVDFRSEKRDKIDLRQTKRFGANPPPHFWWSGSVAKPYSVWAVTGRGDTFLAADLDGDAGADLAIRFIGEIKLSEADFCGVRLQS